MSVNKHLWALWRISELTRLIVRTADDFGQKRRRVPGVGAAVLPEHLVNGEPTLISRETVAVVTLTEGTGTKASPINMGSP